MRKRISILLLAAAIGLGLSYGGAAYAQPDTPPPGVHFPGNENHLSKPDFNAPGKPDFKGPDGADFKRPDGQRPGHDMKNNMRHGKKDFQNSMDQGKYKKGKKDLRKFDKRGDGKNFRPGDHKGGPDFDKPGQHFRPGENKGGPDFGKSGHNFRPGDHKGGPDFGKPGQHSAPNFRPGQPK